MGERLDGAPRCDAGDMTQQLGEKDKVITRERRKQLTGAR